MAVLNPGLKNEDSLLGEGVAVWDAVVVGRVGVDTGMAREKGA